MAIIMAIYRAAYGMYIPIISAKNRKIIEIPMIKSSIFILEDNILYSQLPEYQFSI